MCSAHFSAGLASLVFCVSIFLKVHTLIIVKMVFTVVML